MLKYRVPAAVVICVVFIGCLWYDRTHETSMGLSLFVGVGSVLVLREFYGMVENRGVRPHCWFGYAMTICLVVVHDQWCWEKWHGAPRSVPDTMSTALLLAVLGVFLLQGVRRERIEGAIMSISATFLGLVYVWFLPGFLVRIRHLGIDGAHAPASGVFPWNVAGVELVLVTIFVSKSSDIGGYFVGRFLGKHALTPSISPKKTWEGLAGGVSLSIAVALAWRVLWPESALTAWPAWMVGGFGVVMAVASLGGDLIESIFKRDSRLKDSGAIVPGFGGMMDVVDSLMVSAPLAYMLFLVGGARPGA